MAPTSHRVAPAVAPRPNRIRSGSQIEQSQKSSCTPAGEHDDDGPTRESTGGQAQASGRIYFRPVDINRRHIELSDPFRSVSSNASNHQDGDGMENRFHVESLTQSPLLQRHVRRQWWEDDASDATPSLIDDTTDSLTSTAPIHNSTLACRTIAIVDSTVNGAPVRDVSHDCRLALGACSFLNISYGSSIEAELQTEGGRVILRLVAQVVQRKTGQRQCLLLVEVDMTESVQRAVAEELHHNVESFAQLTPGTCGPETRALLSEVARLKTQYQDFMVVRRTAESISIPWVSQHYHRCETGSRQVRENIIELVSKKETCFTTHSQDSTIFCVPLYGTASQTWICFVQREMY